jgi:hypothetical protein
MSSSSTKKNITSIKDVKKHDYKQPKCQWDPKIEEEIRKYIRHSLTNSDGNIFKHSTTGPVITSPKVVS